MKKRTLLISDIHGHLDAFLALLEKVDYQPDDDQLILLGDYIDRGPASKETIEFVNELTSEGAMAIRGNHDDWFLQWLHDPSQVSDSSLMNGGVETIESYMGDLGEDYSIASQNKWATFIKENYPEHTTFLDKLPLYHEHTDFICAHAGIDPLQVNWKNTSKHQLLWIRKDFLESKIDVEKPIIFGHTPTLGLHKTPDVYFDDNKIGIDGGYTFGYQLNCLIYQDGKFTETAVKQNQNVKKV